MTTYHDYWEHNEIQVVNFLNSIPDDDFTMLVPGINLHGILVAIENVFESEYRQQFPDDVDDIFTWLSDREVMEYLVNRFDIEFEEETCFVLKNIGGDSYGAHIEN